MLTQSEEANKQMASSWQEFLVSQNQMQDSALSTSSENYSGTALINSPSNVVGTLKEKLKGRNPYASKDNAGKMASVVNPLTGRPSTVRMDYEGRNLEQKKQNEKMFVRNQLKELRKLQFQHQKIIEKQLEKDQKEKEATIQQFQQKAKLSQKTRAEQELKLKQSQETAIQKLKTQHQTEIQELQRQIEVNHKSNRKQFAEQQKLEAKRWQDTEKQSRRGSGIVGTLFGKKSSPDKVNNFFFFFLENLNNLNFLWLVLGGCV